MVGYGKSIVQAQRPGWEAAYLDYNRLKKIVDSIEGVLMNGRQSQQLLVDIPLSFDDQESVKEEYGERQQQEVDVESLKTQFFLLLGFELEKMSLFTLKQQGHLANAVGAQRFSGNVGGDELGLLLFDDKSVIFPTVNVGNKLDTYACLGVELLHLLRFICINSIGIRKILKKYNKAFETMDEPHFYTVGGDHHLQQLANSKSIKAVHSSLQSALAESYHPTTTMPSSTSSLSDDARALSLYRFHCVMECSYTLRSNAEILQQPFWDFLSRRAMIVTGANLGGIDGGGGQLFIQWLLQLDPDAILSMSQPQLESIWSQWAGGPTAKQESNTLLRQVLSTIVEEDFDESSTLGPDDRSWTWGGVDSCSMILKLLSTLLYTMNYYIVAPTANRYSILLGADGAFGATLIGASSLSAIFAAFFYSLWYTKSSFKSALVCSAVLPCIGNLIYALAISYSSMPMAIGGRILCGFGSAEVINRQLISACVNFESMTKASALFVAAGAIGMSFGPFVAGVLDMISGRDTDVDLELPFLPAGGIIYNHVTSPGFVMAGIWFLELLALLVFFREPTRLNGSGISDILSITEGGTGREPDDDDRSHSREEPSYSKRGYESIPSDETTEATTTLDKDLGVWQEIATTGQLIFDNPGLPITLLVFGYIELADEVLISSCSMVVRRYFGWHGSVAGFLIASLGALVLPAHFVVEKASHYVSERKILFRSTLAIIFSLLGILNYDGLFYDIVGFIAGDASTEEELVGVEIHGQQLESLLTKQDEFFYDWGIGPFVYIICLSAIFMGTIVLEGVDTSIMAKVTPAKLNDRFINSGLLATLVGTLGRVFGDGMITLSAVLDSNIFVDFVNATFFPLLLLALGIMYFVNRYYHRLAS